MTSAQPGIVDSHLSGMCSQGRKPPMEAPAGKAVAIARMMTNIATIHKAIQASMTPRGTRVNGFRRSSPTTHSRTWLQVEPPERSAQ